MEKICQSCGMPIENTNQLGKNIDGSTNNNYCKYCYDNGEFIDKVTNRYVRTIWIPSRND